MQDFLREKIRGFLVDAIEEKEWLSMKNDIERYQKIKELIINAFKAILILSPLQVHIMINHNIRKLEELDPIFEFAELESFLKFTQILTTGMLSNLDEPDVDDYAAPHEAIGYLDRLTRINESEHFSEEDVSNLGASISVELEQLKNRLEEIDWKKGWKK